MPIYMSLYNPALVFLSILYFYGILNVRRKINVNDENKKSAGILIRASAQIIDVAISISISWIAMAVIFWLSKKLGLGSNLEEFLQNPYMFFSLFFSVLLIVYLFFCSVSVTLFSQTIGKAAFGIKVEHMTEKEISFRSSLIRSVAYGVFLITLGYGFIILYKDPQKRGLHDFLVDTRVVHTRLPGFISMLFVIFVVYCAGLLRI